MLLGGDYTDGVKGVGIVNGMEILQAFPVDDVQEGLQEFREWLDGFGDDPKLPDNDGDGESTFATRKMQFHKKHKSARTRWIAPADFPSQAIINAYTKPVVDKSNAKFSWAKPDIKGLQQFCSDSLGWEKEDTERVVLPVLEVLQNKSKQRRLESYFMKYDDGIKFAEASTRLFPLLIEVSFMLNSSIVPFYLQVRSKRLKTVLEGIQDKSNKDATEVETSAVHNPKKKRRR
jgi:5'-3' exonuclease